MSQSRFAGASFAVLATLLLSSSATRAAGPNPRPRPRRPSTSTTSTARSTRAWTSTSSPAAAGAQATRSLADQTRWGRFNELAERNREDLHEILEQAKDAAARAQRPRGQGGRLLRGVHGRGRHRGAGHEADRSPRSPGIGRGRLEGRALPAARRARGRRRCRRSSASARRPDLHDSQADDREPGPGRARPARPRRLLEGRREVEGEAREVPRARRRACWRCSARRAEAGARRTRRRCCGSRRRWPRRTSTASRCATRRTATTR